MRVSETTSSALAVDPNPALSIGRGYMLLIKLKPCHLYVIGAKVNPKSETHELVSCTLDVGVEG